MSRVRIKWEDPKDWPDVPNYVQALVNKTGITLFKGQATKYTEEHEKAHVALGHRTHSYISPQRYVRGEIAANLLTYRKSGRPRRLIQELRGMIHNLQDDCDLEYESGYKLVENEFSRLGKKVPSFWISDLEKVKEELREVI